MYNEEQRRVLEVKPGITDLASIRYRDENDLLGEAENPDDFYINTIMPDKLALNLEYINKNNIFLDIYIILKTIVEMPLIKEKYRFMIISDRIRN